MRTVIVIQDPNHTDAPPIKIAKDYKSAMDFLLNERWITDATEVAITTWEGEFLCWGRLNEIFGEDWFDLMRDKWDIDQFNAYWTGYLILDEIVPYGEEK